MTRAALTPAASAIDRSPTPKPCSPNCSIAASRIRAAAVKSSAERMFRTLNSCSVERQAGTPSEIRKKAGSVPDGGKQAVAEGHQCRGEQLVLGDEARRLAHRRDLGVMGRRVAGPATQRGSVDDDGPARAQQPHPLDDIIRL